MLPDCMIGPSEPCAGYLELLAERDDAHKRIVELEAALAERTKERDEAIRRAEEAEYWLEDCTDFHQPITDGGMNTTYVQTSSTPPTEKRNDT